MKQATIFLRGEGDAWYKRNMGKPRTADPVLDTIKHLGIQPKSVLEIGCGDGWRLGALRAIYKCKVQGIEPSKSALHDLPKGVKAIRGTADDLSMIPSKSIDTLIYGFCLYLVDRDDLFLVVAEADRVLKDNGYIIIHDFLPGEDAVARKYKHRAGVKSYKQPYRKLWMGSPSYKLVGSLWVSGQNQDAVYVQVIQKIPEGEAWPLLP